MVSFPTKVLMATDGSKDAVLAAQAAVDLANRSDSELHVAHAWTRVPSVHFQEYVSTRLEQEGRRVLDEEARRIEAAGGNLAGVHLREGRTQEIIADLAKEIESDLIVIGSRGLGKMERLLMGSVSEGVVNLASCPVLVIRAREKGAWPPKRLVVGEDGSEEAKRASELAASIGRLYGAGAVLIRVRPPLTLAGAGATSDPRVAEEVLRKDEEELEARAAELEEVLGQRPRVKAIVGDPAADIQEDAEEGEMPALIVVGRRGMGGVKRLVLGSVSSDTLRAASGPVFIA